MDLSQPGKDRLLPTGEATDNAHVESFNGTMRAECLVQHSARGLLANTRLEIGIECESSSQGSGGAHAKRICKTDGG
jgi:Integrase core domain